MGQSQSQSRSSPELATDSPVLTKQKGKGKKSSKRKSSTKHSSAPNVHGSSKTTSIYSSPSFGSSSNGKVTTSASAPSASQTTAMSSTTSQLVGVPQRGSFNSGGERNVPGRQFSLTRQQTAPQPTSLQSKHAQIEKYFNKYRDNGEDSILAEGMERFCVDLDVDPTEFIVLVLAWKFEASQMCRFTREEFMNGCQKMQAHNAKSLKERFPDLLADARDKTNFKDLYNFTFSFGLDHSTGQRSLPIDMAVPLWGLVFTQNKPDILDRWFDYLKESEVKGVSRDTWNMFLPFVETTLPDLSNYDESEAWPSLFDDFVEYEQERTTL